MYKIFVALLIFFTASLYLRFIASLFYFSKLKNTNKERCNNNKQFFTFHVFIPCLQEQNRINNTINYFQKILLGHNFFIYLITTEKELDCEGYDPSRNTFTVIDEITKNYPNIKRIHYPQRFGNIAHQVNYGINALEFRNRAKPEDVVCIYNADSNPDPSTFNFIREHYDAAEIFQQYGNYAKSIDKITGIINKLTIYPSILWQNRWSFLVEFFNSSINFLAPPSLMLFLPICYPVGHGFFIKHKALGEIRHFSQDTHNEDTFLGVELGLLKKKILPLPTFDLSDTPCSLLSIYKQKSNWFFGPFDAPSYFFVIKKKYGLTYLADLLTLALYCLKLFSLAIYWVIGPLGLFISLFFLIHNADYINYLIFLLYYFGFLVLPLLITNWSVFRVKKRYLITYIILGSIIAYGVHGLAALCTIKKRILKFFLGIEIQKSKTAEI